MNPLIDPRQCPHAQTRLTCRPDINGSKRYQRQCVVCGEPHGKWIAKAVAAQEMSLEAIPPFDETLRGKSQANLAKLDQAQIDFELTQMKPTYDEYMKSTAWYEKRDLVLKRVGGICEGCGLRAATQVHHHHYENFGDEFLWDLAAVCNQCHDSDRAHPWKLHDDNPRAEARRFRLHRELERSPLFREWLKKFNVIVLGEDSIEK